MPEMKIFVFNNPTDDWESDSGYAFIEETEEAAVQRFTQLYKPNPPPPYKMDTYEIEKGFGLSAFGYDHVQMDVVKYPNG